MSDPKAQMDRAVKALRLLPESTFLHCSSYYHTAPVGPVAQDGFINAVVKLSTMLTPRDLLAALLAIEVAQNRVRTLRFGPRTLDLDILLYGEDVYHDESLVIPHPELTNRLFCLVPLLEIFPEACLPCGQALSEFVPSVLLPNIIRKC